jgi:hypothetical protein
MLDPGEGGAVARACIANIDAPERRRRLVFGMAALVVGAAAFALLLATGTPRGWRLALLLAFYPGALGVFQWRDHTCVALAARGRRKLGGDAEAIADAAELAAVRAQASGVQRKAMAAAVALVLIALMV